MAKQEQILTGREVEDEFKVNDIEIRKAVKAGTLVAWKNVANGNWHIPRESAERAFSGRKTWITTHQAGEILGCGHAAVAQMAKRGQLPLAHQNPGKRARLYFDPEAVKAFAERYRNRRAPKPELKPETNGAGPAQPTLLADTLPKLTTPARPPLEDQGALHLVNAIDCLSKTVMALANRLGAMDQGLREQHGATTSLTLEVHKLAQWVEMLSK